MDISFEASYTLQTLRKNLVFSSLSVVVVALGFTVVLSLFSLVRNFAYAPLPFPEGDKLVAIEQRSSTLEQLDVYQFNSIEQNSSQFELLDAFQEMTATISEGDFAQVFNGVRVTNKAFEVTAGIPEYGRTFQETDLEPGAEDVVVISDFVWQNYYGARLDIIGLNSRINGRLHTIIGVMPSEYKFPQSGEIWLPLRLPASNFEPGDNSIVVSVYGKLAEGFSRESATNEVRAIFDRSAAEYPQYYSDRSADVVPITHRWIDSAFAIFNSVGGLAVCIFLLVCLNVGNLLTIRASERASELAVRSSMGANRVNLISHVLLESLLICIIGATIGIISSLLALQVIESLFYNLISDGRALPFWFNFGLTTDLAIVAILLVLLLWAFSGFLAAHRSSKTAELEGLAGGSKGSTKLASGKLTTGLVHIQIILSFLLLVLSGVFIFEMHELYNTVYLENPDEYYTANFSMESSTYDSNVSREQYRDALKSQLDSASIFERVSFTTSFPGAGGYSTAVSSQGSDSDISRLPRHGLVWIGPDYFQTIGVTDIIDGRFFDSTDNTDSDPVAIVDELIVQRMQFSESPIGRQVELYLGDSSDGEVVRIVGVISQIGGEDPQSARAMIYRPMSQNSPKDFLLMAKIRSGEIPNFASLRNEVYSMGIAADRDVPIFFFSSISDNLEANNSLVRFFASMFINIAFGALVLAVIGVYGLMSRSVASRTYEIGIRRALGETNNSVLMIFVRQGLRYLSMGLLVGGGSAVLIVSAFQQSSGSLDLSNTLAVVVSVVTIIVSILIVYASYMPVKKALSLEPGEALHYE